MKFVFSQSKYEELMKKAKMIFCKGIIIGVSVLLFAGCSYSAKPSEPKTYGNVILSVNDEIAAAIPIIKLASISTSTPTSEPTETPTLTPTQQPTPTATSTPKPSTTKKK